MTYEIAQKRYLTSEGIEPTSHWRELTLRASGGTRTVRTHALEMGAGPPVLLLHGGGGLAAAWAPIMARIAGRRLIAPDRPGCGASSGLDYDGVDLRAHAVEWLEAIYDWFDLDQAVIVANSMGARWATWFALTHPDRVTGIAMLGIPALLLDTSAPLPMRLLGRPLVGRLMMAMEPPGPRSARALWQRLGHRPEQMSEQTMALTEALPRNPGYGPTWRSLIRACVGVRGPRPGLSLDEAQLARLTCPITLAVGDNDPFGSVDAARRAVDVMPDGALEIAGAGHLPWLDQPARYAAIVNELIARCEVAAPARAVPA